VLFYALLSVLEPQRKIWRKPTKKVLVALSCSIPDAIARVHRDVPSRRT